MRTPKQIAADEQLVAAIEAVIDAGEDDRAGFHLSDWVVLYSLEPLDPDDNRTTYGMCVPGEHCPSHRLLGLMQIAQNQIITGGWD